ncbi:unnamed protein product, partial [Brenthis ino]
MRFSFAFSILFGVFSLLDGKCFRRDYTYYADAGGYLKLHEIPANWQEARLRCHLEGAKLASPLTSGLSLAMRKKMEREGVLKCGVFTGIHASFSRGDFHSIEGVHLSRIPHKWAKDEPDNYNDKEQCIMMLPSGELADVNCSEPLPYLCYYKSSESVMLNGCGTVDPQYEPDVRTGSCYKFHTVPRTWSRAFMTCTAEGGYLAIINSEIESQVIKEIFAKHPGGSMPGSLWNNDAFMGFHDWGEHGEFLTIQGETLKKAGYDKFSPGEPNNATTGQFCGAVYRNVGQRFRCDYTYYSEIEGYLKLQEIPANWHEARLRCHLEGGQLASPINNMFNSIMRLYMDKNSNIKNGVFTGIHATFSRGDFHTIEGVPLSIIPHKWGPYEPNNLNDEEQCITMSSSGEISDADCTETLPYFCYKKSPKNVHFTICGTSDLEYKFDERTGSCYKFHTVPRTWSRAFMTCTAEGGYLAIINSEKESKVIKDIFLKHPAISIPGVFWKDVAFVGFHDWGEHGEFLTIQGQTLTEAGYAKFAPGEPNNSTTGEFCGAVYRNGMFDDLWCENRYAFICEKDPLNLVCEMLDY